LKSASSSAANSTQEAQIRTPLGDCETLKASVGIGSLQKLHLGRIFGGTRGGLAIASLIHCRRASIFDLSPNRHLLPTTASELHRHGVPAAAVRPMGCISQI
jgi:hypothetical protein